MDQNQRPSSAPPLVLKQATYLHRNASENVLANHRPATDVRVSHLLVEPCEDVLLRYHLEPVPVHFLPQVCVLILLQLDERHHLGLEGLLTQAQQTLTEGHQKLLDLLLDELRAANDTCREFILTSNI